MAYIESIQVIAPTDGYAKTGENVDITVTFDQSIDYTGLRGLKLNTVPVKYAVPTVPVNNGVTEITFRYTVEAGVHSYGESVSVLAFELEAGHVYETSTTIPADLNVDDIDTTGQIVEIDGRAPSFSYAYHWPNYVKPGDTLRIRVFSDEQVMLPTATISGREAALESSDGQEHVFTYTVNAADAEDADLSLAVTGPDMADNIGSTTVLVPAKVDKLVPNAPPTPVPDLAATPTGYVNFTWSAAEDQTYGEDGIHHYVAEIYMDSQITVTHTTSGKDDRAADITIIGGNATTSFTCRVKAVDQVGRESGWSALSDPSVVDTRKLVCTLTPRLGDYSVSVPFDVDIHFKDILGNDVAVSLPSLALIQVVNGSKSNVTAVDGTNSYYRLKITPTKSGSVTIQALGGTSKDAKGTPSYKSNKLSMQYDVTRPTCAITGPTGRTNQPLTYKITFSKPVVDFTDVNLTLTGHESVTVTGRGAAYTAYVVPPATLPATITIKVADSEVLDDFGNANRASSMLTAIFDDVAPEVVNVSALDSANTVYGQGDVIKVQVSFDKVVYATAAYPATLKLYLGTALRNAKYLYGSGSDNLVFGYAVAANDPVVNSVTNGDLVLSATAYIKDKAGNLATDTCAESLGASNLEVNPAFNPPVPTVIGIHSNFAYTKTESGMVSKLDEGVIRSGVGDGNDLRVDVAPASDNWVPHIRQGYAYYQDQELYLFAEKRTITTNNYTSGSRVSLNFNKKGYNYKDPFCYGPVIVKGDDTKPYVFVTATMRAFGELSTKALIAGTNNYRFTSPGLPVEVYRTDLNEPMRRVPSMEAVQDMNEYFLETVLEDVGGLPTLKYFVVAAGSAKVWCSFLYDSPTDWHSQLEICVVDTNMRIRSMYKEVVPSGTYKPLIRVLEDGVFTELDGTTYLDGNVLTLPQSYTRSDAQTGSINPGDRVGIKYWVNHSWALDNGDVIAFHQDTPNPKLTIEYEASLEEDYKTDSLINYKSSPSYVQLNPLYDGVSSGFLYVVDSDTVPYQPSVFRVSAAPVVATAAADPNKSQPVRVLFRAEDVDGDPVAGYSMLIITRGEIDFTKGSGNTDVIPLVPQAINGVNITPIYVIHATSPYGAPHAWVINTDYTMTFINGHWNINWLTAKRPATSTGLTFHFTPALGKFEPSMWYPSTQLTDWKGELSGIWRPAIGGTRAAMRASKADGSLCKETRIWQYSQSDLATETFSDTQIPQKVYLTITDDSREPGTKIARAYVTDVTGAYPVSANVRFQSQFGRFSVPYPNEIPTNSDGVAENSYHPAAEDIVWAYIIVGGKEVVSNKIYLGGNY